MAAKFDLNDDSVVVVIGSGAGGGVLATDLALKGIKVVCLEAGSRIENHEFVNDEWESFTQLAWTDMRTTSGSWRVARDFANLPAWIVKAVGGSTTHWAGASLRFQEHEFRTKTVYGDVKGASLMDWPITLDELAPYYAKAEDRMGVTLTNGIAGLPGNNNYKVLEKGAKAIGYQKVSTGRMAINSADRHNRGSCQQIGFCFQGCKSGAKWSTLYAELPKGEATGKLEVRPNAHVLRIEHDAKGKVTGVVYADKSGALQRQKARIVAVAGNSIESPRILLNSASNMFKDGLANSSGQVGRNYMRHLTGSVYGVFDKPVKMWRGTTMAGIVQDEAVHNPKRGFVGGYELETLSLGLPFMAAFLDPAPGAANSPRRSTATKTWPGCGSSARTCRRRRTASRCPTRRTSTGCRWRTSISTIIRTTSPCAPTPTTRARRSTRRSARRGPSRRRPTRPRTISAPTACRPTSATAS